MRDPTDWFNKPFYNVKDHLTYVQALFEKYDFNTIEKCTEWSDIVSKDIGPELREIIHDLLEYDGIYRYSAPTLEDRDYLIRQAHQLSEDRSDNATEIIVRFFRNLVLPPAGEGTMTVPRYKLTPEFHVVVVRIHNFFIVEAKYGQYPTFPRLTETLTENWFRLSGVPIDKPGSKKLIGPHDYDGNLLDYLVGTPFYDFFLAQVPFSIPRDLWTRHAFFAAPSGHGKSQIAGVFLREALEDPEPRAIIVIDPHGKKEKSLFEFTVPRVPPERLVVIDPDIDPPDVGLLDFGVLDKHAALETFLFLMSSMAGGLSPKQETSIPSLFELLSLIPDANLLTLQALITERPSRGKPPKYDSYIAQLEDVHQDFFRNLWYGGEYEDTRKALQWKLLAALSRPAFKKMFSATRNSIDMDRYLRERKVVVINGGEQALGKDGMRIFILFLIGQYYAAAKRRKSTHLAMCMVDEASYVYQSPIIADILAELRGYGCAFAGWTQHWAQVGDNVKPAILGNTAIKGVGPLSHNDASVIGREIFMSTDEIRSLKGYSGQGTKSQWAMFLAGMDRALVVSVPYGVLEAMPIVARTGIAPMPDGYEPAEVTTPPTRHDIVPRPEPQKSPEDDDDPSKPVPD